MSTTNVQAERVEVTPELLASLESRRDVARRVHETYPERWGTRAPLIEGYPAYAVVLALVRRIQELEASTLRLTAMHNPADWHDDDGTVLWWSGDDLMYIGGPLDTEWPGEEEFTFWTRVPNPRDP